jgi:glycosyltransferase involved in cell wall biosynthesis
VEILHVYGGPFPSHQGTQVAIRGLLAAQARQGHRVVLRCAAHGAGTVPEGVEIRRLPAIPGGTLRSGPSWARVARLWALAHAVEQDARSADVIHAHHVDWPLVNRRPRIPYIYHLHTSLREELHTYGFWPGAAWVGGWVDHRCIRSASAVVVLSQAGADIARFCGARSVVVVPPGLDDGGPVPDREAARRTLGLGKRAWVVYAGNLDRYQDLFPLLQAVIRYKLPLLVVTGDDPSPLRHQYRRLGGHLSNLRTLQETDYPLVRRWCAAGDVAAIPRARCSGFPIKLLNLQEVGLPVVARHGAVDPRPGVILADPEGFGPSLAALCADPDRAQALGQQGRIAALTRPWDAAALQMEGLYAAQIHGQRASNVVPRSSDG